MDTLQFFCHLLFWISNAQGLQEDIYVSWNVIEFS
jgi:hypothetical protein